MSVVMPSSPVAPASLEWRKNALVATSTNPFTGQQIVYAWGAAPYFEGSARMASMSYAQAQNWTIFLTACNGPTNPFSFPTAVCASFPYELTTDGTTPRLFRLKGNQAGWSIKEGKMYSVTFEFREAI